MADKGPVRPRGPTSCSTPRLDTVSRKWFVQARFLSIYCRHTVLLCVVLFSLSHKFAFAISACSFSHHSFALAVLALFVCSLALCAGSPCVLALSPSFMFALPVCLLSMCARSPFVLDLPACSFSPHPLCSLSLCPSLSPCVLAPPDLHSPYVLALTLCACSPCVLAPP